MDKEGSDNHNCIPDVNAKVRGQIEGLAVCFFNVSLLRCADSDTETDVREVSPASRLCQWINCMELVELRSALLYL